VSTIEIVSLIAMLLVAGGISSRLVELIKRASWSSRAKWALSVGLSAAVGLATAWIAGDVLGLVADWGALTAVDVFAFMAAVYAVGNGFYELWFKPAGSKRLGSVAAPN